MLKPRNLQTLTPEMKEYQNKAITALYDNNLSKEDANKIIDECNSQMIKLGLKDNQTIIRRK